jgi:very-short-patch-repair endonuclease
MMNEQSALPADGLPSKRHESEPKQWATLKPLAHTMRHKATVAEVRVWEIVRDRRCHGVKFRRQFAIDRFVVDFASIERRLVIEVDGSVHDNQIDEDSVRQECIESHGYMVIRFTNEQVLQNLAQVRAAIAEALALRSSMSEAE